MSLFIKDPISVSNYYIWSVKEVWTYLSKFWWSWFYNETSHHTIYWSLFNFLVFDTNEEWKRIFWRFCIKINSIQDIKFINQMITLSNKKYFYTDQKSWLWKNMKTQWFTLWILSLEDLKTIESHWFEIYQWNSNLFQWMSNEELYHIETKYKKIIFLNEFFFSMYYMMSLQWLLNQKELWKTNKWIKLVNWEFQFYTSFFKYEMKYLLNSNSDDLIFINSLFLDIDKQDTEELLLYAYYLKLSWYFTYFNDLKDLSEEEKQKIYKILSLLSSNYFQEKDWVTLQSKIIKIMQNLFQWDEKTFQKFNNDITSLTPISIKEFFYWDQEEKKLEYEKNLFKPEYWFNWLTDFLFKQ